MKMPFNLKVIPGGWGNPLMEQAYIDFIHFAIGFDEIINHYKKDTGIDLHKLEPRNPIEAMVDKACGVTEDHRKDEFNQFIEWLTINHWGVEGES